MSFTLGPACPEDIPALLDLLATLFSIEQDFSADAARRQRALTLLLARPEAACIMVARDPSGTAIAMAGAQLVISTAEGAPSAWVEDMVVAESWRGRGAGKAVLDAVLDWARQRGATRALLLADLDNTPALDFYSHLGWAATRLGALRLTLIP